MMARVTGMNRLYSLKDGTKKENIKSNTKARRH